MNLRSLAVALSAGLASCAIAQSYEVGAVNIDVDYWRYVGIVDTSMSPPTVVRVVAFLDPSKAIGANITVLQYTRDEGAGWLRDTFDTPDQWKVVDTLKQELSIGDDQDYKWGVSTLPTDGLPALKVPMAVGVKEVDPLAPILEIVSDPEALIDDLVETGYAAAKAPTDFPADGDPVEKMDLMADALMVQGMELEPSTRVVAEFIHDSGLVAVILSPSIPTSRTPVGPPTPWTDSDCYWYEADGNCNWIYTCKKTRSQIYTLRRTIYCLIAGVPTYCDQTNTATCTQEAPTWCRSGKVPGRTVPNCQEPLPPAPVPTLGCTIPTDPNVPLKIGMWNPEIPTNCTGAGWVTAGPPCPCP